MTSAAAIPAGEYLPAADITLFKESSLNPRRTFDKKKLAELMGSMAKSGQLTPVTARITKKGYELASGHRRLRAAQELGLTTIRAIVREMSDAEFIEVLNVDNLQREDVHPLEEAEGYKNWLTVDGMNVEGIMAKTGKSESYVYDRLKLLALIKPAQKLFLEHRFTAGHAILLARLSAADQKRALDADSDDYGSSSGGMWRSANDNHPALGLEDPTGVVDKEYGEYRVPVSVREFQAWIDDHCRFEKPDAATPHLFPQTAENLAKVAATPKAKLVEITRSYVLKDDVKDPDRKVLTERSWQRADGRPDLPEFEGDKAEASETCDYSVMGLVVAGEGRGESFEICINKKKCTTHWPDQVKAHLASEKRRKAAAAKPDAKEAVAPAAAKAVDPLVAQRETELGTAEDDARTKAEVLFHEAVAKAIKSAPTTSTSALANFVFALLEDGRYGLDGYTKRAAKLGIPRGTSAGDFLRHVALAAVLSNDYEDEFDSDLEALKIKVDRNKLEAPFIKAAQAAVNAKFDKLVAAAKEKAAAAKKSEKKPAAKGKKKGGK